ncbi:MAG TPA: DNA alkylation repair protein [Bacteroidia bacterium]|nr:DNA alkylation repair protein [Bacteroidia bacterium]
MKHFKKHHPVIVKKLQAGLATDKKSGFKDLKKYIGTQYDFIGLSVPKQREVFKAAYEFNNFTIEQQLEIWNEIWHHSQLYEAMTQALFFVSQHKNTFDTKVLFATTKNWVGKIDNWAHSDGLSDIFSYLLEKDVAVVYPQIKIWNKSDNPWERRQSIVALLEYSKKRKKVLPVNKLLPLVKTLLEDENYFVQKGIGWTLREIGNVYPKDTWAFLVEHHAKITAVAFSPAIEKLSAKQKEELKRLRKKNR